MNFLKNHPFEVEAYFESSVVLTFAFPKEQLQNLIPDCLDLDTYEDKWAFAAIALVQTKNLRPKGFPSFLGNDFFLIGYRIFVKYRNKDGKRQRGLFILKSETDKKKMEFLGNIFTHYNYSTIDIFKSINDQKLTIKSNKSDFEIIIDNSVEEVMLPTNSPFKNFKDARRFAGPLPFTFSYDTISNKVLIVEGVRQNWIPKPIHIIHQNIGFFNNYNLNNAILANAYIIEKIPYYWKKGKTETWTH